MIDERINNIYNKKVSFIGSILKIFKLGFFVSPFHFILFILIDLIHGILSASTASFTERFFEKVTKSTKFTSEVFVALLIVCFILVIRHVLNGVNHTVIPALKFKMDKDALNRINKKVYEFPAAWFENQDFLNFVEKAYNGTEYSFAVLIPFFRFLFLYLPYSIVMSIYLYSLDPVLSISMIVIFIPTVLSYILRPMILMKLEDESAEIRRENVYYRSCMTEPEFYKETRSLGIFSYFKQRYLNTVKDLNNKIWNAQFKLKLLDIVTSMMSLCGYGVVLILLVYLLLKGSISVASFAAVFAALSDMFLMVDETLEHFLIPAEGMATVKNFLALINADTPRGNNEKVDFNAGIHVNNVSYSYIGSDRKVLQDINLDIQPGETIAIVGANGSGKTTLSRLLLGIYVPNQGYVKIGKSDTKVIDRNSITKGMSAVFQNFQKYRMTLKENITISDSNQQNSMEQLNISILKADLDIVNEKFVDGMDTMLSRDFGGIDLSGGQWQRVAIARGLFRNRSIVVMDEPTAAIDPIEETKLYEKFADISKNKTTILITHRIGSAKIADRIVVMDQGRIVEIGKHDDLLNNNGLYKTMYESQMKWYQ